MIYPADYGNEQGRFANRPCNSSQYFFRYRGFLGWFRAKGGFFFIPIL